MIRTRFPQFDAGIVSISSDSSNRARESERSARQVTLPKKMRTMKEGIQNPVLTFTRAAPTSDRPTMEPTAGRPA